MADAVDIPDDLLRLMDVQAKSRGLSRDRFIVEVLRRSCPLPGGQAGLSGSEVRTAGQRLRAAEIQVAESQRAVEDLAHAVRRRRRLVVPAS